MAVISMKALLEAGVHFGHRTRRWFPRMKPYIFTERNGIHIIDLQQTMSRLDQAYGVVRDTVAEGGTVLFVGTKKQAQESIAFEADRCEMPYVNQRWLGGSLTNFQTLRQRIEHMTSLEEQMETGQLQNLTKKEALRIEQELTKLHRRFGGLRRMKRLPQLLFVADVRREDIAIKEANTLGIPVVAMVDTNCDPDPITYVIPSNDDAIRAIKLMTGKMADAVIEGTQIRGAVAEEEEAMAEAPRDEEGGDEKYLGAATLAKIRDGVFEVEPEQGTTVVGAEEFTDAPAADESAAGTDPVIQ
jgi:small subunit ribosomal protein S2